jgi:hypothetical protein
MSQEMQKMMINMKPTFILIYEVLVTLWNVLQTIINGIRNYTPVVYNVMWNFTEALYNNDSIYTPPGSPKTPLIDKTWCNIDPNNIIENEDKKRI